MSKTIVLKPLEKQNWAKVVRYKNCQDSISPYFDRSGSVKTGLDPDDEKKLGEALGENLAKNSNFWVEYRIQMSDKERVFDLSNPEHELAYKFLLAHKRVANSLDELTEWPYADYVIYDEAKAAKRENVAFKMERKAAKLFDDLSPSEMRDVLKLYPSNLNITDSTNQEIVESTLYRNMKEDPAKFIGMVEDPKRDTKTFIKELNAKKILTKKRTAYYYGEDIIGHDLDAAAEFIDHPERSSLKAALKQALNSKKK